MPQESPATYYFAKRHPNDTICEKITRLNIVPNQCYAAVAIFSAIFSKRGCVCVCGGGGGAVHPCPPCSAAYVKLCIFYM